MPTVEDVSRILTNMDYDKYNAAVRYIYYLADLPANSVSFENKNETKRSRQVEFVKRTAGKLKVDEQAIEELRMRSMI